MAKQYKTAVIYARYSSDNQTEQSIEGQLHVCQDYAKSNNILILDTYIDRAMTGTNDNRPAFQKMMADCKQREWDYVLVYKFDRFSRNKYETAKHKATLKDNGVVLVSATEYLPDTPERIIMESIFEGYAEYYSAELSQKVKRGMRETRNKGNFTGGFVLYGYKIENRKVVIDESKAEIVRYIYNQYAQGVFTRDIIADLTEKGILNHGKPFAMNTVYNILKNEKYSGVYRHGDEVYTNIYPQIVPPSIYTIVQKKMQSNQRGKRSTQTVYLLRGMVKCGYCGSSITAECGTSRNGKVNRYYKCIGRKHGNGCTKVMERKELLEEFIVNATLAFVTSKRNMDQMIKRLLKLQDARMKENAVINILEREKRQCEVALENIVAAIERGNISNAANKRMKELEDRIASLEKKLLVEKNRTAVKLTEADIRKFFVEALKLEPRFLIGYLIKEIRLFDDKAEIYFNSPINSDPDESQGTLLFTGIGKIRYSTWRHSRRDKDIEYEIYI